MTCLEKNYSIYALLGTINHHINIDRSSMLPFAFQANLPALKQRRHVLCFYSV